jgi:hypothetical protein
VLPALIVSVLWLKQKKPRLGRDAALACESFRS